MSYQSAYAKIVAKLEKEIPPSLTYHNVNHAKRVLQSLDNHILTLDMDPRKAELVRLAGIGHDIGYIENTENHELIGIRIIKPILKEEGYSEQELHQVSTMIWATKLGNSPRTFLEKMLVDANLAYIGSEDYDEGLKNLYKEWVNQDRIPKDYPLFLENRIKFMEEHTYYTDFAKAYNQKSKNIEELKAMIENLRES